MEVTYSGIRLTIDQIAASARGEDPDVIGLSILSESRLELVPAAIEARPDADQPKLTEVGVTRIDTPNHEQLADVMHEIVDLTEQHRSCMS